MKVKTSTVVVKTFVSDDGLEFNTKAECLEHEQDIAFAKGKEIVDKLPHFIYTPWWVDPDFTWDWYFVSSCKEFSAVREVLFNNDASAHDFDAPKFPCWLAFSSDCEGYGNIEGTMAQVISDLERFRNGIEKEAVTAMNSWSQKSK